MITNKTIYQHAILRSLKKSGSGQTTGTAQGAIASFSTNTEKPIVSGIFDIDYNENGVSGMFIGIAGKNLFNEDTEPGTLNDTTGLPVSSDTQIRSKTFSSCKGGEEYYICVGSNQSIRVLWYDENEIFISETINIANAVATAPINACFFKIRGTNAYGTTYRNDISINYPSDDTTYEAYSGDAYLVTFGDTIYGGTFNSVTGILTSTLDSDGTPLETPVMIEITPVDINTLADGITNIFCNTGDTDISYIVNGASKKDKVLSYLPIIYGRKELL